MECEPFMTQERRWTVPGAGLGSYGAWMMGRALWTVSWAEREVGTVKAFISSVCVPPHASTVQAISQESAGSHRVPGKLGTQDRKRTDLCLAGVSGVWVAQSQTLCSRSSARTCGRWIRRDPCPIGGWGP